MTTMEPAPTVSTNTAPLNVDRVTAPTAKKPIFNPTIRVNDTSQKSLFILMLIILGYASLRLALTYIPYFATFFQREHMRVDDVTFSPDTALIRMENQTPRELSLTIDTQDVVHTLPDTLGHLSALRSITIIGQSITTIPDSIGSLTNLESLTIYNTPIRSLPASIGNLTNLKELTIVGGNITSLPDSMTSLTHLETLNLAHNHIRAFPTAVGTLPNLTTIDLTGNPIRSLPSGFSPSVRSVFLGNTGLSRTTIKALETPSLFIYY